MIFSACLIEQGTSHTRSLLVRDASQRTQNAVSGRVQKILRFDFQQFLRTLLRAQNRFDFFTVHLQRRNIRVQVKAQMRLTQNVIQQDLIPENNVCIRVFIEILQLQRTPCTHFLCIQISRSGRTARPDANFTAGIAAKHRSICDQHGIHAKPCRANRGCYTGRTSTDHCQFGADGF